MEPEHQRSGRAPIAEKLLVSILVCIAFFTAGIDVTFKLNLMHYGREAFNHDAGAGFAVLIEGLFAGTLLAIGGIVLCANKWFRC